MGAAPQDGQRFLRDKVVKGGQSVMAAIGGANRRLDAKGLTVFDPRDETDRAKAIARTIGVSLELLSETERARFGELAVFPEDAEIPVGVVARLWEATGGLADFETEDLLSRLHDLSLLLDFDLGQRFFRLHDTTRHFLQDCAGKEGLVTQHKQLVAALDDVPNAEIDPRTRRYFYLYLPHHLAAAQEREKLDRLLLDPGWLKAKLLATSSPQALVADYEQHGVGELQTFIGRTLRLTTGILARDERQLIPQLLGRIMGCKAFGAAEFLEASRRQLSRPAILVERPSLTPPGAETARLEGHWSPIRALCLLPNGRRASGSSDSTIRQWDAAAGVETARLEGHSDRVTALCLLSDSRLASGSSDKSIRLWDAAAGVETARLEGHSGEVTALCLLPAERRPAGSAGLQHLSSVRAAREKHLDDRTVIRIA
jgi:APAF-1 helical domain/WD domain, G-beta repeat